jgi:hypothetical protein
LSSRRKRLLAGFITLAAALPLVVSVSSAAATPTDLFLSEYIEGSSNDPSGTYRVEMTPPNGQVATASFGLKP